MRNVEDRIEDSGELRVAVTDKELDRLRAPGNRRHLSRLVVGRVSQR